LWSVDNGKEVIDPIKHNGPVWTADFSPDGTLIATGGEDSLIRFWEITLGGDKPKLRKSTILRISDGPVWWITFKQSVTGLLLAAGGQDRSIRVLNMSLFEKLSGNPDRLKDEAEQRSGFTVRLNGNESEIVPIQGERFVRMVGPK
jgi:WD40 repeat protein